jgi:purine-binding chemotaxis protein CheW
MNEAQSTERGNGNDARLETALAHTLPIAENEAMPETMQEVLARRAARLAEAPAEAETGEQVSLLLIRLGREVYGLDAQYVDRVEPVDENRITHVPRVPDWVAGMVNLRGRVLSVVDLARFFGLPAKAPELQSGDVNQQAGAHLVVVETPHMQVALLADGVLAVEAIPTLKIQETMGTVRGLRPEHVRGVSERKTSLVTPDNASDSIIVVLDMPALLADERLVIHEEV